MEKLVQCKKEAIDNFLRIVKKKMNGLATISIEEYTLENFKLKF